MKHDNDCRGQPQRAITEGRVEVREEGGLGGSNKAKRVFKCCPMAVLKLTQVAYMHLYIHKCVCVWRGRGNEGQSEREREIMDECFLF